MRETPNGYKVSHQSSPLLLPYTLPQGESQDCKCEDTCSSIRRCASVFVHSLASSHAVEARLLQASRATDSCHIESWGSQGLADHGQHHCSIYVDVAALIHL